MPEISRDTAIDHAEITPTSDSAPRLRVCMFVFNNFTNDSRVQKQAETLLANGYDVTVMARLDNVTTPEEVRNGILVKRVPICPLSQRVISFMQKPLNQRVSFGRKRGSKWMRLGRYVIASILYASLFLVLLELAYHPYVHTYIQANRNVVYVVLIPLLVFRGLLFRMAKKMVRTFFRFVNKIRRSCRNVIISLLKSLLLPFNRQFCYLSFYCQIIKATRRERFDIYHAHDLNTLPVAWLGARRDKARLVYDSHELYVERNRLKEAPFFWKRALRCIEGFLVRRCDAVYTVNKSLAQEMARRYKIDEPGVIMNAPESFAKKEDAKDNTQLRQALSIRPEYKILLYVGSITFNRGLEALVKSMVHLPDCYLVLMGYGSDAMKESLQTLAGEQGVADRFAFYGPVPTDQVIHYASSADLGVAPIANACMSYYFCSPNKLFEYMNAGLPVIASDFPELEKTVLGHAIGYTFDPEDPEDIAKAARAILDDPDKAREMHDNALHAATLYNWGNESQKLLGIYEQMLKAS